MKWGEANELFKPDWRKIVFYNMLSLIGSVILAIYFRGCGLHQQSIEILMGPATYYVFGVLFSIMTPYIHFIRCSNMVFWFVFSFIYWYILANVLLWLYENVRRK